MVLRGACVRAWRAWSGALRSLALCVCAPLLPRHACTRARVGRRRCAAGWSPALPLLQCALGRAEHGREHLRVEAHVLLRVELLLVGVLLQQPDEFADAVLCRQRGGEGRGRALGRGAAREGRRTRRGELCVRARMGGQPGSRAAGGRTHAWARMRARAAPPPSMRERMLHALLHAGTHALLHAPACTPIQPLAAPAGCWRCCGCPSCPLPALCEFAPSRGSALFCNTRFVMK